jgi:hypothetical protein
LQSPYSLLSCPLNSSQSAYSQILKVLRSSFQLIDRIQKVVVAVVVEKVRMLIHHIESNLLKRQ